MILPFTNRWKIPILEYEQRTIKNNSNIPRQQKHITTTRTLTQQTIHETRQKNIPILIKQIT